MVFKIKNIFGWYGFYVSKAMGSTLDPVEDWVYDSTKSKFSSVIFALSIIPIIWFLCLIIFLGYIILLPAIIVFICCEGNFDTALERIINFDYYRTREEESERVQAPRPMSISRINDSSNNWSEEGF